MKNKKLTQCITQTRHRDVCLSITEYIQWYVLILLLCNTPRLSVINSSKQAAWLYVPLRPSD